MSTSTSEFTPWLATLILTAGIAGCGLGFNLLQNRVGIIGGKIALPKLVWLSFAVLFWLGFPLLIALDSRTPHYLQYAFGTLFASMATRGAIELWMLYISKNWSPAYGIAHDVLCVGGLAFFLSLAWIGGEARASVAAMVLAIHGLVTMVMFVPEIYFAWYMRRTFHTKGGGAIYFVPDEERHRRVLGITTCVNVCLTVYLPIFIFLWLYV